MPIYQVNGHSPERPGNGEYWVAPDAHVIGQVVIGRDVGIWFGAVLRGDNEPIVLGQGTNIQEGVMIHTDPGYPVTIGNGCTIGHHAIVHGCTIGENSLVGMGATVMNGAKIGNNCIIGSNALVTEGKEFPDGSLIVGAPARAVRQIDEDAIDGLRKTAEKYVQNHRTFKATLKVVE